jgi:hypothetical protein
VTDPLQALLRPIPAPLFPPSSRYHTVATATLVGPDGRAVVYLRGRFAPPPDSLALVGEYAVAQGDRLDLLAARYLGDPELFWRLCDANAALRPDELTEEIGRVLRITLPEGVPGGPHA